MRPPPGGAPSLAPLHSSDAAEIWARYKTGGQKRDFRGGREKVLGIFTHEYYDDEDDQDDKDEHVAR